MCVFDEWFERYIMFYLAGFYCRNILGIITYSSCWILCNFRSYSYCPPSGVELVVIIHLNPRKNNVPWGEKLAIKEQIKIMKYEIIIAPPSEAGPI